MKGQLCCMYLCKPSTSEVEDLWNSLVSQLSLISEPQVSDRHLASHKKWTVSRGMPLSLSSDLNTHTCTHTQMHTCTHTHTETFFSSSWTSLGFMLEERVGNMSSSWSIYGDPAVCQAVVDVGHSGLIERGHSDWLLPCRIYVPQKGQGASGSILRLLLLVHLRILKVFEARAQLPRGPADSTFRYT